MDQDYVAEDEVESSDDCEPANSNSKAAASNSKAAASSQGDTVSKAVAGSSKGTQKTIIRASTPREEIRVYMDPPVEKGDGDTDVDSGR
jgi:hypothetical protein